MLLPDEIDPKSIRDQLDRWEIDINRALGDPEPARFQQEMRSQHGFQIDEWIHTLELIRDRLQPDHGHAANCNGRDPDDLTPPGVENAEDAATVAEIYSLIGYLRSQIGRG